jgi:hypothetical protein
VQLGRRREGAGDDLELAEHLVEALPTHGRQQRGPQPRVQHLEHPAQHDDLGVEQVDQVADPEPQPATHPRHRVQGRRVLGLETLQDGGHHVDVLGGRRTEGPHQGRLAGLGLPAPARPARAPSAPGVDQHVARLAGVARGPQHRPAPDHQPGTDPDLAGDEHEVVEAASRAATVLAQRAEVRLVGHVDPLRRQVEARREQRAEGHALPPQVGGEVDEAVRAPGQPGHGRADARQAPRRDVAGEPRRDLDDAAYDVLR